MNFLFCLFALGKEWMNLKKEVLKAFYERYAPEQIYEYLKEDPVYQEREKELREAIAELEPVIKVLGRENWLKYDRVLTAHNNCEAYALQAAYIKGVQDALEISDALIKEENNGGN